VAPIVVKFYMMVHIGPGQVFSLFGNGTPREPKIQNFGPKFWLLNREYLENGKSKRRMSIITPARLQLSKNVQHGTVAPREKGKYVFLPEDRCLAPIGVNICTMVGADIFRGLQMFLDNLCLVTDISATVAPIGVKFCMMVHIGLLF